MRSAAPVTINASKEEWLAARGSSVAPGHQKARDGGAARELAGALAASATLRELDLSDNCIGTPGAAALAEALFVNRALAALRLANNFVDERAWPRLRDALGRNGTLQRLTLSGNMLPPHTFEEAAA